jgi:hypothetical protein
MSLHLVSRQHRLRERVEGLVRSVYARQYGARVTSFPEAMMALVDLDGEPICVAGIRFGLADCFSEIYLDEPIEKVLARASGAPVARDRILEVTGLASARLGSSFTFLQEVVEYGRTQGMRWGVFTATGRLRRVIGASCLPVIEIAPARPERISNPLDWGTYYQTDPWVCAMPDSIVHPLAFFARGLARGTRAPLAIERLVHAL